MVYTANKPWTAQGRALAIEKAVGAIYERYFASGPRWVAKYLPERSQMPEYGSKVSAHSREILLAAFGVESFIDDYAILAIQGSGDSRSTRQTYNLWISDETRHSKALGHCLVDSGLYSPGQLGEYLDGCDRDFWTFERQTGYEATPIRGAVYAMAQERQTKRSYREMQKRLWAEYGSPVDAANRPLFPAISGVCRTLSIDEGFHEGVFRQIARVYLEFWPDKALQAMWEIYRRYRMPVVKLPNAEAFMDAVLATGIDSAQSVVREILSPTYSAMGLESRAALKRAAKESWDLPDGAVLQVGSELSPDLSEGAIPYKMNPDGSLLPVL